MKSLKKITTFGAVAFVIGVTSITGFAASIYNTPAEALAGLTGEAVESVIAEKVENKTTYGSMAADAGVLDAFKVEVLEIRKDRLADRVEEGTMTQERADAIIERIEERQLDCDGTGSGSIGREEGARFGSDGEGQGLGRPEHRLGGGRGGKGLGNGA